MFSVETFSEESIPDTMMQRHYLEVAEFKSRLKLNPDWNHYAQLQQQNHMAFIEARVQHDYDREMIGYVILLVRPHLHYRDTIVATDDLHYLTPEWRRRGIGTAMLRFAERVGRDMGASIFCLRTKRAHDHGELFTKMGYTLVDHVYLKDIYDA